MKYARPERDIHPGSLCAHFSAMRGIKPFSRSHGGTEAPIFPVRILSRKGFRYFQVSVGPGFWYVRGKEKEEKEA